MATSAELRALMAVSCTYCGAGVGVRCGRTLGNLTIRPTTLDGESHDARWRAAGLGAATVLAERVPRAEPVLVAAGDLDERPW